MNAPQTDIISVECPSCGNGLNLHRRAIGISGHCVHCSAPMVAVEREVGPNQTIVVAERPQAPAPVPATPSIPTEPTPPPPAAGPAPSPFGSPPPAPPLEVAAETIAESTAKPATTPSPTTPAALPESGFSSSPFGPPPTSPTLPIQQTGETSAPPPFASPQPTSASPFSEMFPSPATTGSQPAANANPVWSSPAEPTTPAGPPPASTPESQELALPAEPDDLSFPAAAPSQTPEEKTAKPKAKKVKKAKPPKVKRDLSFGWILKLFFGMICAVVAAAAIHFAVPPEMFADIRRSIEPVVEAMPSPIKEFLGKAMGENDIEPFPPIPEVAPAPAPPVTEEPDPEADQAAVVQPEEWDIPAPQRIEAFGENVIRGFYTAPSIEQRLPFLLNHTLVEAEVKAFYKRSKTLPKLRSVTAVGPMHDPTSNRWFGVYDVREQEDETRHRWCVVEVKPGEYKIDWPLYQQLADDALPKFMSDPAAPDREFTLLIRRSEVDPTKPSPLGPEAMAVTLQMPLDSKAGRLLQISPQDFARFNLEKELVGQSAKIVRLQLGWRSLPGKPGESFPSIQRIYGWGAWQSDKLTLVPK